MYPPKVGPKDGAKLTARAYMPMARPLLSGGYMLKSMVSAVATKKASPLPCTDLKRIISPKLLACPHIKLADVKNYKTQNKHIFQS